MTHITDLTANHDMRRATRNVFMSSTQNTRQVMKTDTTLELIAYHFFDRTLHNMNVLCQHLSHTTQAHHSRQIMADGPEYASSTLLAHARQAGSPQTPAHGRLTGARFSHRD
jgi:hypothetical protein